MIDPKIQQILFFIAETAFSREPLTSYSTMVVPAEELVDKLVEVFSLDKQEVGDYIELCNEKLNRV